MNIRDLYDENGYYIFKKVLKLDQINKVMNAINFVIDQQLSYTQLNKKGKINKNLSVFKKLKILFDSDINRYLKVVKSFQNLSEIYEIFFSSEIKKVLDDLKITKSSIPTGPVFHLMSRALRIPNGYFGVPAHQDYPSMCGSLDAPILWIPLVDIDKKLYPLDLIPKSNKKGLSKGIIGNNCYEIDKNEYSDDDFVSIEVQKQDIIIMSPFTIHRSNTDGKLNDVRFACSIRFDNLEESTFIERAYPSAYKRVIDRNLFENDKLDSLIHKNF